MPMEPAQEPLVSNSGDPIDEDLLDLLEDNIQDRDFTDVFVGKKLKALYKMDSPLGISNTSILFSRSAKWHTLIKNLTT